MVQYLPLFALFVLACIFAGASFLVSGLVAPKRPNAAKEAPYECGIVPTSEPTERFPVRFYLIAMIFIIFDIEVIFLYPWAVESNALGGLGLGEMIAFSVAVLVCLAYLISNGALDWGPARDVEASEFEFGESTIRKVNKPAVRPSQVTEEATGQPAAPSAAP